MYILWLAVCIRKRVGGLKLEDLPGLEALQIPGVILIILIFQNLLIIIFVSK